MASQVVKVRRDTLLTCMTCPLCDKLLKEATTISLCLHTFCRKCIYEKLSDDEVDTCPVCDVDLGCIPVEKLRPDHNLQDIRAKIFSSKRRRIKAHEITSSVSLPIKRKERSLSSLVVSTPKVSMQTGLTGRRTKSIARKVAVRGSSFGIEEPSKKEEDPSENCLDSSSSPETLSKIVQHKRQSSPSEPMHDHRPDKNKAIDAEAWEGNVDLWKPLNCLVEVANRTKSSKIHSRSSSPTKSEPFSAPDSEVHLSKPKFKEHQHKSKVYEEKNGPTLVPGPVKRKRLHPVNRKSAAGGLRTMAQAMLDATWAKQGRKNCPIWFTLVASEDQERNVRLPQISASYLRIKDGNLPVSFIQKYLVKKLDLTSEAEVEITCQGQPVLPTLQLQNLVDLWLQTAPNSKKFPALVGSSAKDFVMVLSYSRRLHQAS